MKTRDLLAGMALGAGIMFLLDQRSGARRRALLRDQVVHARHRLDESIGGHGRDLRNRARGALYEMRQRLRHEVVDDRVLEERVRAQLGHLVANPGAIEVSVHEGRVTLFGPVHTDELSHLLAGVRRVRGVAEVEDRLDVHEPDERTPELPGTA